MGSPFFSVGPLHWNCWVVHICFGSGYNYKFHCLTDRHSVVVDAFWHVNLVLLLLCSDAYVNLVLLFDVCLHLSIVLLSII